MQDTIKPVLIFTWGNPSRGDDALGTEIYEQLQKDDLDNVDLAIAPGQREAANDQTGKEGQCGHRRSLKATERLNARRVT